MSSYIYFILMNLFLLRTTKPTFINNIMFEESEMCNGLGYNIHIITHFKCEIKSVKPFCLMLKLLF